MKIDIKNKTNGKRVVWKFRAGGIVWDEIVYKSKIMDELRRRARSRENYFATENNERGISFTSKHIDNIIESTFESRTPKVFKSLRETLETIRD